ncbi:hypothetical protein Ntsu_58190 [Nocardia sp. IFM 10818]
MDIPLTSSFAEELEHLSNTSPIPHSPAAPAISVYTWAWGPGGSTVIRAGAKSADRARDNEESDCDLPAQ